MVNKSLLVYLEKVLGSSKSRARSNFAFYCPQCNKIGKNKLEICLDESSPYYQNYQCWICNDKLKGKKLNNLFKTLKLNSTKLRQLVKTDSKVIYDNDIHEEVKLPKEFISLTKQSNSLFYKQALSYLTKRGVTQDDIIKYGLGYCEQGPYSNRIIIPSYDSEGNLNYFSGRSFNPNSYLKYKNPEVSRNIIPFELFINWNSPIIITEGPFDALAIKRNVIPLLGKNIQINLMKKIITSQVKKIYIALDQDALKQALSFCEKFMNEGKKVYFVPMEQKDPSEIGFKEFFNIMQDLQPLTFSDLLKKRLSV